MALQSEFEDVQCDPDEHVLSVTTQSVVLDGIELGRFQIRLDWQCLQETSPYAVVVLDPNPAQSNDGVTHPHVNGQTLCEGSGRGAIQAALTRGGSAISLRSWLSCSIRTPKAAPMWNWTNGMEHPATSAAVWFPKMTAIAVAAARKRSVPIASAFVRSAIRLIA